MKKNILECFNIGGTYRIMTYDHRIHENFQGPSVLGSKCPGPKCPRGPNVAQGDTWTPGTFGPRTFRPQDTWTPRLFKVISHNSVCSIYVKAF